MPHSMTAIVKRSNSFLSFVCGIKKKLDGLELKMHIFKVHRVIIIFLLCFILTGCCLTNNKDAIVANDGFIKTEMYLAAAGQDNVVASDQDWAEFKKNVVAEKFPNGFSVYKVNGAWKTKKGKVHLYKNMGIDYC